MTEEQIIAAAGEPVAYHENGRWSFNSDGGPNKWRERKKYNGPLYTADAILSATKPLRDRIAELEAARKDVEWQPIETAPKGD